jgi:hypothetical protein
MPLKVQCSSLVQPQTGHVNQYSASKTEVSYVWAPQGALVVDINSIMPFAAGEEWTLHPAELATICTSIAPAKSTELRR